MWHVIFAHLFGALQKEANDQFCRHNVAHASWEPFFVSSFVGEELRKMEPSAKELISETEARLCQPQLDSG
jgi:hypothetical protein